MIVESVGRIITLYHAHQTLGAETLRGIFWQRRMTLRTTVRWRPSKHDRVVE